MSLEDETTGTDMDDDDNTDDVDHAIRMTSFDRLANHIADGK